MLQPLPVSPLPLPLPLPTSLTHPLGYRAAMIRLRAEAPSTSHPLLLLSTYHLTLPSGTPPLLPIPLPTLSSPLPSPSTDPWADVCEVCLPPQKRLCCTFGLRFKIGESSSALTVRPARDFRPDYGFIATLDDEIIRDSGRDVRYGITDSWDEIVETMQGAPATDEAELARDVNRNTNDDDNHASRTGVGRIERVTRECTYPDFMKCQPLNFKGTKGVVELTKWFEKMETNSQVMTAGPDVAYAMTWADLKKNMTAKYCPRVEMKKLEFKLWNLKMFSEESDKIERYVDGLPDMIHESVVASKPKTMKEAIEMSTELMDKKIRTFTKRQTETKRKQGDNQQQQQQNKRQNTKKAYTAGSSEKNPYRGFVKPT
nr:hypothetical protein [Tanacetum cinerariifolium]